MADTYTTIQGETWDQIALKVYGAEKYAGFLMSQNYPLLDTFIFSAGTTVITPPLPEVEDTAVPSWRAATYENGGADPYE